MNFKVKVWAKMYQQQNETDTFIGFDIFWRNFDFFWQYFIRVLLTILKQRVLSLFWNEN